MCNNSTLRVGANGFITSIGSCSGSFAKVGRSSICASRNEFAVLLTCGRDSGYGIFSAEYLAGCGGGYFPYYKVCAESNIGV